MVTLGNIFQLCKIWSFYVIDWTNWMNLFSSNNSTFRTSCKIYICMTRTSETSEASECGHFRNPFRLLTMSCSRKDFMMIFQTVQELWRWQTQTPVHNPHTQTDTTESIPPSLRYCCAGDNNNNSEFI